MKKQIEKAIAETSSVIDILQATSEFYKKKQSRFEVASFNL